MAATTAVRCRRTARAQSPDQPRPRHAAPRGAARGGTATPTAAPPHAEAHAPSSIAAPQPTPRHRRQVTVELRPVSEPLSAEELRRREQELERLIIKAACRRAARLAGLPAPTFGDASVSDSLAS